MKLNEIYEKYKENPTPKNYEALGKHLLNFVPKSLHELTVKNEIRHVNEEMKEEIEGNTYIKIFQYLDTYKEDAGKFSTWVYSILSNELNSYMKEMMDSNETELKDHMAVVSPHIRIDQKLDLKKLLKTLPEDDRKFMKLKLQGYSGEEIDGIYGRKAGWSEVKYDRLVKKMQESLLGNSEK